MLDRAQQRLNAPAFGTVQTIQSDMRALSFEPAFFDLIVAGQVLHHLREDAEWELMFGRFHQWLRPSGALFVADFITYDDAGVQLLMLQRYSQHLLELAAPSSGQSPGMLRNRGFTAFDKIPVGLARQGRVSEFDVLHKNASSLHSMLGKARRSLILCPVGPSVFSATSAC
jgi:tRNA (cmo5U34)-methyltransferase